jgi:hypothetical protein
MEAARYLPWVVVFYQASDVSQTTNMQNSWTQKASIFESLHLVSRALLLGFGFLGTTESARSEFLPIETIQSTWGDWRRIREV